MSGMVERVARAIWKSLEPHSPWDDEPERDRDTLRAQARAAIEAMREPTEGMKRARYLADFGERGSQLSADDQAGIWQAMIDEALKP